MKAQNIRNVVGVILLMLFVMTGCTNVKDSVEKVEDLSYTVVPENEIPQELKDNLEGRKESPFKVTFADSGYIYICIGYGEQKTGGYSIKVKELYLAENAIYIDTLLMGPREEEIQENTKSYPYIVLKTEYRDKSVVFL